jgi:hypothetical protein
MAGVSVLKVVLIGNTVVKMRLVTTEFMSTPVRVNLTAHTQYQPMFERQLLPHVQHHVLGSVALIANPTIQSSSTPAKASTPALPRTDCTR